MSSVLRLFTAIDLPAPVAGRAAALIEGLPAAAGLRWSSPENLHITTKFIGAWPEASMEDLKTVLTALRGRNPIEIALPGLGWFPNPHHPRVLWAPVRASNGLRQLAADTESALAGLGVAEEKRSYTAHVTLARVEKQPDLEDLRHAIADLEDASLGEFTATSFGLYRSDPGPGGSRYTMLHRFSFESSGGR